MLISLKILSIVSSSKDRTANFQVETVTLPAETVLYDVEVYFPVSALLKLLASKYSRDVMSLSSHPLGYYCMVSGADA